MKTTRTFWIATGKGIGPNRTKRGMRLKRQRTRVRGHFVNLGTRLSRFFVHKGATARGEHAFIVSEHASGRLVGAGSTERAATWDAYERLGVGWHFTEQQIQKISRRAMHRSGRLNAHTRVRA